ncbi:MAG TPA: hypothetical protein PLV70_08115 [Flavobacteriales bacterium]|nr:hypothetical protein [Flavobacteriales bacterium]
MLPYSIIAITGPRHSDKMRMMDAVSWHLWDRLGVQPEDMDPEGKGGGTVVLHSIKHFDIALIHEGTDPRFPKRDPLGHVARNRCNIILCPVSARSGSMDTLNETATKHDYSVLLFNPIRKGRTSPYSQHWRDVDQRSKLVLSLNGEALSALVIGLIRSHKSLNDLEAEVASLRVAESQQALLLGKKIPWSYHLPARIKALHALLMDLEGWNFQWDIAKQFVDGETDARYSEVLQLLHALASLGRARQRGLKWIGL